MEPELTEFIEKIQHRKEYLKKIMKPSIELFDGMRHYINTYNLYLAINDDIPSKIIIHNSEAHQIVKRIETEFAGKIIEKHYMRFSASESEKYKYTNVIFVLPNEIIIEVESMGEISIYFNNNSAEEALAYEKEFAEKTKRKKICKINMLSVGPYGTDLIPLTVKKPVLDLAMNYNDDLKDLHEYLLKSLRKKDNSGLVLLHGKPGTGKSTYIRYLINSLKKKIIFLPPAVAGTLDSPAMTSLLVENPNAIFIIEDAEHLIKSRENSGESNISMLLNLTDGLLGECLGTLIICTFNTELKNIDEALLRKGRLIASYKFEELAIEKLLKLKDHLGIEELAIKEGMVLSDLYYTMENRFGNSKNQKSAIGF